MKFLRYQVILAVLVLSAVIFFRPAAHLQINIP